MAYGQVNRERAALGAAGSGVGTGELCELVRGLVLGCQGRSRHHVAKRGF